MERIRATLRSELDWFDRAYFVDWAVTGALFVLARAINWMPHYQRAVEPVLNDPSISHPHGPAQVPGWMNDIISFYFPIGVAVLNGLLHASSHELHHGVLACVSGWFLMDTLVNGLKNRVGRFRPDFLDRCQWDAAQHACTGIQGLIFDGRRSFPSGHSSSAFAGLGFISLLLALKFGTHATSASGGLFQSKMARLAIVLTPLFVALWIAVTRVEDYYHHPTDIIAGSLIGIICALVTFHIYWPSPFSSRTYNLDALAHKRLGPRLLYGRDNVMSHEGFELASVDEDEESELRSGRDRAREQV